MTTGLVRSPDARNKSSPFPVFFPRGSRGAVRASKPPQNLRVRRTDPEAEVVEIKCLKESSVWLQGDPKPGSDPPTPQKHIDVKVQKGAKLRCGWRQAERRCVHVSPWSALL